MGRLGGAMVLGKLPVLGCPSNLVDSRARAYCACSGCRWGFFGHFTLIYVFSPLSPSLWVTEILSQRTVKLKTTDQQQIWSTDFIQKFCHCCALYHFQRYHFRVKCS